MALTTRLSPDARNAWLVEDMLAYRGIIVTHKTVREWAEKFGRDYANTIRRRTPQLGDKWHLDEAVVTINGERHFLWRAVDQDGFVLEVLVQKRRDTKAARRFVGKFMSGQGAVPRVMVPINWDLLAPPIGKSASRSVIIASTKA